MIRLGSLFSGIGGLELGVAMALARLGLGHDVAWQVECDAFCRRVLAKHWPDADRSVEDVRHAGQTTLAPVDLIVGGFPCQDVSPAGRGAGLAVGTRSGLWYEYRRVVSELQPPAVIVENVAGGASRWLCEVRTDLHDLGYRTRALGISAADIGAPHLRRRIFVIALGDGDRARSGALPDSERERLRVESGRGRWARGANSRELGHDAPLGGGSAQPRVGRGAHGLPAGLDRRWPAGRGEAQRAWEPPRSVPSNGDRTRRPRLKGLGNAVVPACAERAALVLAAWIAEVAA